MNRNNRTIALALAAIALAITGFVVLQPSDDDKSSSSSPTPAVTTTTTEASGTTETTTEATTVPDATVIHLTNGEPVGGKQKISVSKGDTVRLNVTADEPNQIHVHGYNLEKEASPGSPAVFKFVADIEGRFEVESHTSEAQIAELTVNP